MRWHDFFLTRMLSRFKFWNFNAIDGKIEMERLNDSRAVRGGKNFHDFATNLDKSQ